jgi:hypothetical protein
MSLPDQADQMDANQAVDTTTDEDLARKFNLPRATETQPAAEARAAGETRPAAETGAAGKTQPAAETAAAGETRLAAEARAAGTTQSAAETQSVAETRAEDADDESSEDTSARPRRKLQLILTGFPVLLSIGLLGFLAWQQWSSFATLVGLKVPAPAILAVAFLLSLMPVYVCVVHNVTRARQLRKLDSLAGSAVATTTYFKAARRTVQSAGGTPVGSDYFASISVYATLLMIGFTVIGLGLAAPGQLQIPSVVLAGWSAANAAVTGMAAAPNSPELHALVDYQVKTFVVVSIAFIGAYVYALTRLLDRINNNDLYPLTLYYYATRSIIAVFVAAVLRHAWSTVYLPESSALVLVGFVVGMAPDSFITAMTRQAFKLVNTSTMRVDPSPVTMPAALPLLMIDDLGRDKIDRLNELGIDNAHTFSRLNPFLLWPRLPYDLTLIVDWIGQAHLYTLLKDTNLAKIRGRLVRDSFDLQLRLADSAARTSIIADLNMTADEVPALMQQLETDPAFVRLKQVRAALAQ